MKPTKPAWILVVRENLSKYEKTVLASEGRISTSADVSRLLGPRLGREECEVMVAIAVDGQNHVKHLAEISRGGLHGCAISARDALRPMICAAASGFILVHNHPSGNPTPSAEDISFTRAIKAAAEIVGCPLLDHVVLAGDGRHASMLDLGLI